MLDTNLFFSQKEIAYVVPGPKTLISANPALPVVDETEVTVNKSVEAETVGKVTFVAAPLLTREGT